MVATAKSWRAALALFCVGLGLTSCGTQSGTLAIVSVSGIPAAAQALQVSATFAGQPVQPFDSVPLTTGHADTDRLGLTLAQNLYGVLAVQVQALAAGGTVAAQGTAQVQLNGEQQVNLSVALVPTQGCMGAGCGPMLTSIAVSAAYPKMATGFQQQVKAQGTFSDSSMQDISSQVTWSSSDTGVATVDTSGVVASVAVGTANIIATWSGQMGAASLAVVAKTAQFDGPAYLAIDGSGTLYVSDSNNNTIRKITPVGLVSTFAGSPGQKGSMDSPSALFDSPDGLAVDSSSGNIYVADTDNYTIRKIAPDGVVSTLAGTPRMPGHVNGPVSTALFYEPNGVALDGSGNLYVADFLNFCIRMITPATPNGMVSTIAGNCGMAGSADGSGSNAGFNSPNDVKVDSSGNLYVADYGNDTIRMITPAGYVSTLAGSAGMPGSADSPDGPGSAARFDEPAALALDGSGNLYVADYGNNTIRKITPAGVVSTFAGTAGMSGSTDATGSAARFNGPFGLLFDGSDNLYVADYGNNTVRKITPAGVVSTVAGIPPPAMPGHADSD